MKKLILNKDISFNDYVEISAEICNNKKDRSVEKIYRTNLRYDLKHLVSPFIYFDMEKARQRIYFYIII